MKDTDMNNDGQFWQESNPGKKNSKQSRKGRGGFTIPGGAGAAGQIPIKGNERKQKDDPLQPDTPDQGDE